MSNGDIESSLKAAFAALENLTAALGGVCRGVGYTNLVNTNLVTRLVDPTQVDPTPPVVPPVATEGRQVFDHWVAVMGKTKRAVFDRKRQRAVNIQLEHRTVAELKRAVDGCKLDPFSMGQNERAQEYNDFCLIFRDAAHVEKFIAIADAATGRPSGQLIPNADPAKLRADASAERRKLETRRLLDQQAEQGKRINPEEARQRLAELVAKVGKQVDPA